ncbi:MAG: hypothetical protein WC453_02690 [Patescibacteria group bacterium]
MIALAIFTSNSLAQTDSAITASKYLGVLYTGTYDQDTNLKNNVSLRLGSDAVLPIMDQLNLNVRGGYETGTGGNSAFGKFYLEWSPEFLKCYLGYAPRPITLVFKPAPLSADGQLGRSALKPIPGSNLGAYAAKEIIPGKLSLMAGSYFLAPSKSVEWDGSIKYKPGAIEFLLSGYTSRINRGLAVGFKTAAISVTGFTTSDSLWTAWLNVKTKVLNPYVSITYNRNRHKYGQIELGWDKIFSLPYGGAKVRAGMSYECQAKLLNTFVQMFL